MQAPLVSVVVPTYNRGYCVARTIDSALGQTHPAVEVIVVDDGSQDDTAEVIASRYLPIRPLRSRPSPASAAR